MRRALVVDDDPSVLALVTRWLFSAGYEVITASDFKVARTEIRLAKPDLVILDVRLGEFNGLQLAILAQQERADVSVVLISGWDDQVLRREAEHLGAIFIQKPFTAAALLDAAAAASGALPA